MGRRAVLLVLLFAPPASADTVEVSVPPKDGEKYTTAAYRLWLPDGVKAVRAVIVRQHGCGRNGIDHADDLQWQALAAKHDAALFGVHYPTGKECKDWFDPVNGTERAFLEGLKQLGEKTKHAELAAAPWAIWGHSGGALWATHMANRHPDRVIAVWARSQAVTEYLPKALGVPIVFNYGEGEKTGRFESVHKNSQAAFTTYRPKGARWAVAIDPKSSHDCRNNRHLAIPFFDRMLAERLPRDGAALRSFAAREFWRGEAGSLDALAPTISRGNPLADSWLIDEGFARKWSEFCRTGEVKDTTPPPAPREVVARAGDGGVTLLWAITADLESGLKEVAVYKNGIRLADVPGQKWNYGDEPEPRLPAFRHADPAGRAGDRYEVSAVNHAGLESEKTAARGP